MIISPLKPSREMGSPKSRYVNDMLNWSRIELKWPRCSKGSCRRTRIGEGKGIYNSVTIPAKIVIESEYRPICDPGPSRRYNRIIETGLGRRGKSDHANFD